MEFILTLAVISTPATAIKITTEVEIKWWSKEIFQSSLPIHVCLIHYNDPPIYRSRSDRSFSAEPW
jgi:hypothetical protein